MLGYIILGFVIILLSLSLMSYVMEGKCIRYENTCYKRRFPPTKKPGAFEFKPGFFIEHM